MRATLVGVDDQQRLAADEGVGEWIAGLFDRAQTDNPFGHSGRRISDYYAGLTGR